MLFSREQILSGADDFMPALGRALIVWVSMQNRKVSVADAATAFNTDPELIREAVDAVMFIGFFGPDDDPTKQILEADLRD